MHEGRVPGTDAHDQAIRLAGALAELGVPSLTIIYPGGSALELTTRQTNLPGEIADALTEQNAAVLARALDLEIGLHTTGLRWVTPNEDTARRLQERFNMGS